MTSAVEVPRRALLDRFAAIGDTTRVVVVIAPAGYGKTTALRQWVAVDRRAGAWVSLTPSHDDPDVLVAELHAVLHEADAGRPVLVVLDDLDGVRSRGTLDLMVDLAERLPRGSCLVLAGRRWPRARLGALKGADPVVEFGPDDLAFAADEAADLLTHFGVAAGETVARLLALTEGWAAGLRMTASAVQHEADPDGAAGALSGDHPAVARFFRDTVLSGLSVETTRFLLRTSILDRMSASLCDAALDMRGSAAWLAEIQELGLFVVPDGDGLRYRHLFHQMLRAEVSRREPGEDLKVLRRASGWFEENAQPEAAIASALAGQAQVTAARLITAHTQRLLNQGRLTDVGRWIDMLDETTLERYPPVAAMGAFVFGFLGDAARAKVCLGLAEAGSFDGPLPDGSASLAAAVARVRATLGFAGVDAMKEDADLLWRLEPHSRRFTTLNTLLLGVAAMLTGDTARAANEFARASQYSRVDERSGAAFCLAQRSLLAADEGDWRLAALCAQESRELRDRAGLQAFAPGLVTLIACARVALHAGDADGAREAVRRATMLYRRPSLAALPWLAAQTGILLGHLLLDLGDIGAAELKATEARRALSVMPTTGVLTDRAQRLVDAVEHTRHRADGGDGARLTRAELRVLHLLPTHLSIGDIGDQLVVSRNTVKSQVAAIYRKLDAGGRAEAVRKAHELGLLDDSAHP